MTDDLTRRLDELDAEGIMHGFSIWPCTGGYQANLFVTRTAFRVRHGTTPSEAIDQLLNDKSPALELSHEPEILGPPAVDEPPELGHGDLMDFAAGDGDEPRIFD